ASVFGAEDGHPQLPAIYKVMVEALWPASIAPHLDRGVYSGGRARMSRLTNRRRADTGRYKVPLAMREVLHWPWADLEALTRMPRRGVYWPAEADLSPCPALVKLYHETLATLKDVH